MTPMTGPFAPAFFTALSFFAFGVLLAPAALVFREKLIFWGGYVAQAVAGAALTFLIVQRWIASGHPPLSGLFDAVVVFVWMVVISYLVAEAIFHTNWLGLGTGIVGIIMLLYAAQTDTSVQPLMPVLKSVWLYIHVFAYMLSYGILTVAFFASVAYYIYLNNQGDSELTRRFDRLTYRLIAFGFPLLTAGVVTGAIWANRTWGTYWGWDPKETWSLITWIVYAAFLHLRYWSHSWKMPLQQRHARLNWIAMLGFAAIIMTFLMLKFLPSAAESQHIYQ